MAKQSSTKSLSQSGGGGTNGPGFSFGGAGSRIAKPLRGGGGAFDLANGGPGPNLPFISSLQNQEAASPGGGGGGGGKRSSWFFNKHKD